MSLQTSLMAGKQATGCVMYYGMPEKDMNKLKNPECACAPKLPLRKMNGITPAIVSQFEKDMKGLKKPITIKSYDADHAFANPSNPKHDKQRLMMRIKLVVELLKGHL
jgi:carboxymethylenebutenolidase